MTNISVNLDTNGINSAIEQIEQYKLSLQSKLEQFVSELADIGIEIARKNIFVEEDGTYIDRSNLVFFEKNVTGSVNNVSCIIVATAQPYVTSWKKSKEGQTIMTAQVNPLLMAEFGSGTKAIDGHAGTFPSETAKKNVAHGSWAWYDTQGNKHLSTGNTPSRPLFKAKEEMVQQIVDVAKKVFSV